MKFTPILALLLLLATGCREDFINLNPINAGSTDQFYKSANDMTNAINAVYAVLQSNGIANSYYDFGDLPTDDAYASSNACVAGHCDFDNLAVLPSGSVASGILTSRWTDAYKGIYRANIVLNRITSVQMDETRKGRIIGEAKFLRAFYYFTLVQTFGDVPLVTKELASPSDATTFGREPVAKVYAQIQQDLTEAASALPATYATADAGRATSGAANGLLGRVLLFQGKFSEALPLLKAVIDSKAYQLLPTYEDVFSPTKGNNAEILFSIQYVRGGVGEGNLLTYQFAPENSGNSVQIGGGNGSSRPTPDIEGAFEAGDLRKAITISPGYTTDQGVKVDASWIRKFYDAGLVARGEGSVDYPILRYSDVLLMYAECLNETGNSNDGLTYLNTVRRRAGIPAKIGLSQTELRIAIEQERRVELAFEGLRFFDLIRTNRAIPVLNAYFSKYKIQYQGVTLQFQEYQKVFPIPQDQIDVNPSKITQNRGY
ncbi:MULTISPECIES: RagB/SusD family nutrient uptake outer membrane protein [unclassified Spirosoma]|uniref:RagB/SusD family nutrient uptake outer membrane protein n=1 Tax=unclassified Spirosoma TaxID=2621999 RepID=UPI00095BCFB6|nr:MULTISPECIES: RagB/SusD family nutrient uptake outer membrane protein [unclassified Spirosoma]MBN8820797.1 RagB/SusD family nutrient uptake outer membrane protein [Spirosoma sp.]OJW72919.1 MAG: hypothetical protein BGO59_09250 [Spirosoma sp. 48-14]